MDGQPARRLPVPASILCVVALCLWIGTAFTLDVPMASVVDLRADVWGVFRNSPPLALAFLVAAATSYLLHVFTRSADSPEADGDRP